MKEFVVDEKNIKEFLKYMEDNKIRSPYVTANKLAIKGGYKRMLRVLEENRKLLGLLINEVARIENELYASSMSKINAHNSGADDSKKIINNSYFYY